MSLGGLCVVFVHIARQAGYRIACWQCFKFGFPVMSSSVALSALYFWLVFLR
jgi:Na+/H+ antiporter NhaD/arsenite permease-like protein